MKFIEIVGAALVFTSFSLAGCGGPEGTYKLDKAEMKKAMESDIAKMPSDKQGFAKLGLAMIDSMDMTVELQSGGKLKLKSTMPSLGSDSSKTEEKEGTWTAEGDSIVLTSDGKPTKCTKSSAKLRCESDKKDGQALVFEKS